MCSRDKTLPDIHCFSLRRVYYFRPCNDISNYDQNVFGNVSDKRRKLIVEGSDVRFITGFEGTVARDDDCTGVVIKYGSHNSRLDIL